MSRDRYLLLCDVTMDTGNTSSSIVACWTMFTELLPGNALIKSVTIPSCVMSVPYDLGQRYQRHGGTCRLHLQGRRISQLITALQSDTETLFTEQWR
jgi:hypothetical protein